MEEKSRYATKKKGKTEVYPFRSVEDIKGMMDWFRNKEQWDNYLTFMFGILLGRRIGDTLSIKWSDIYYENGRMKDEITTIEEQKTGKTTMLAVSPMLKETIELYINKTNRDPMKELDSYIFMTAGKKDWINRKNNKMYLIQEENDMLNNWCILLCKDISDTRKNKIINDYKKQNDYKTFGDYLYYCVEYKDIVKSQSEIYRRNFDRAAKDIGITYNVSTHSTRKSFGMWSKKLHPNDCNSMEVLCKIFNHADTKITMNYIGLTDEKMRQYYNDMGDFISSVDKGNADVVKYNSPVITLKTSDIRDVIKEAIKITNENELDKMSRLIDMVESLRIKSEI